MSLVRFRLYDELFICRLLAVINFTCTHTYANMCSLSNYIRFYDTFLLLLPAISFESNLWNYALSINLNLFNLWSRLVVVCFLSISLTLALFIVELKHKYIYTSNKIPNLEGVCIYSAIKKRVHVFCRYKKF